MITLALGGLLEPSVTANEKEKNAQRELRVRLGQFRDFLAGLDRSTCAVFI
jgi:hypothetical protein